MTTANSKPFRRIVVIAALPIVALTVTGIPATLALAQKGSGQAPTKSSGTFGDFHVTFEQFSYGPGSKDLAQINVSNADMQSTRYDMSGSRIQLTATKKAVIVAATASGNVRVVARDKRTDPQTKTATVQKTIITCDNARYKRESVNTTRGRLDMNGHVRTETYLSQDAPPIVSQSESGYIDFLDSGYKVTLVRGSASGTANESTETPKSPKK